MRRGLNGEYRRNYALAAGSVFCGAVGEVLVNEYYRVEKQLRIAAAEAENIMARAAIERLIHTLGDETAQAAIETELEEVL